jgi:predicted acetyltransferase
MMSTEVLISQLFTDPQLEADGELTPDLVERQHADTNRGIVPAYVFAMMNRKTGLQMGRISLRIGNTDHLRLYAGHIGYAVDRPYRGNHYAERSCRLLLPLARAHGMNELWITCNPENLASRRTLERLGAELVEIVDVPLNNPLYRRGERQKCRFRVQL